MSEATITKRIQARIKRKPAVPNSEPPAWFLAKLDGALKELRESRKRIKQSQRESAKLNKKIDAVLDRLKRI